MATLSIVALFFIQAVAGYSVTNDPSTNRSLVIISSFQRLAIPGSLPELRTIRLSSFVQSNPNAQTYNTTITANNQTTVVIRLLWLSSSDKLGTNFYDYTQSVGAVNVALARLASERVLYKYSNLDLEVAHAAITANGGCSAFGDVNVIHQIFDTLQYNFDAVIGPPCGEGALAVSTFVESLGKPTIVWVAGHKDFSIKSRYPHVTLTFVDVEHSGECVLEFLRQVGNWTRVAFIYDAGSYACGTIMWPTFKVLAEREAATNGFNMPFTAALSSRSTDEQIHSTLIEANKVARIMFTCTTASAGVTGFGPAAKYDAFGLRIMGQAIRLGIVSGEYQWMLLRIAYENHQWPPYAPLQSNASDSLNEHYSIQPVIDELKLPVTEAELYLAYRSVIVFDQDWGITDSISSDQIIAAAFQPPWNADRRYYDTMVQRGLFLGHASMFAGHLADGIYMYGRGVRTAIDRNLDYSNSTVMYDIFRNISFVGQSGYFAIDDRGKRLGDLMIYTPVANYYETHPLKRISRGGVMRCASLAAGERAAGLKGKLDMDTPLGWFGTTNNRPPPDTPVCGWHNEYCQLLSTTGIVLVACGGASAIGLCIVVLYYIRRRRQRLAALLNTDWNLQASDLSWKAPATNANSRRTSAFSNNTSEDNKSDIGFGGSTVLPSLSGSSRWLNEKPIALFRGKVSVYVKPLHIESLSKDDSSLSNTVKVKSLKSTINVANLSVMSFRELRAMKDVEHDNVNRFVGIVTKMLAGTIDDDKWVTTVPTMLVVTAYCGKGSLASVLHSGYEDEVALDWLFKYSFMCDIANGTQYLHNNSVLRWHGRMSSSSIVLDARWTAKLTDFGLLTFGHHGMTHDLIALQSFNKRGGEKLLWTAPEVLRNPNLFFDGDVMHSASADHRQAADIYSFGILLSEIIYQTMPYSAELETQTLTVVGVIKTLTQPGGGSVKLRPQHSELFPTTTGEPSKLLSPFAEQPEPQKRLVTLASLDQLTAARSARQLMMDCWHESASERPNVRQVVRRLRAMNKESGSESIVDRIINKLEAYAENLEAIVRERTSELVDEKQRADALLSRMLPASVADRLKLGKPVIPEHYEESTIFFSDIVSFTTISSLSAPMQVVQLLNDLYTFMDGTLDRYAPLVYKVETIGDAYMVVSGIPLRTQMHARILASVALAILANIVQAVRISHVVVDPTTQQPMQHVRIRIGLNSGPCVAGVVGLQMPRYCLFGDTVNVASRMESNGEPMRIHISKSTRDALEQWPDYVVEDRGVLEIKGKGSMNTYWLADGPLTLN